MFERFTEEARRAVLVAHAEAEALGHPCTGTQHLLLGLLGEEDGTAFPILARFDVGAELVRLCLPVLPPRRGLRRRVWLPFTPRAKKVLGFAVREASSRHAHVGTVHILLGLVADDESAASRLLRLFDEETPERIRHDGEDLLSREAASAPEFDDLPGVVTEALEAADDRPAAPPRWTPLPNNLQDLLHVLAAARRDLTERCDFERATVVRDLAHELAELVVRAHEVLKPQEHR